LLDRIVFDPALLVLASGAQGLADYPRCDTWNHYYGQAREFMYKYTSANTISSPDGTPNGFVPDPNQFVIYTWK
jgi:hypothetical protein